MSQRNPMNERYQTDEHKGQTRKSAARAKPKTKAASTVRVQSATKTPQQKKAEQKAQRRAEQTKQRETQAKYYNPPTAEYKLWRRIWWALLIVSIGLIALSFLLRWLYPENDVLGYVAIGVGYVTIISALIVDFVKIRKIRKAYQAEMEANNSKEARRLEKQKRAEMQAQKAAEEAAAQAKAEAKKAEGESDFGKEKKGLFAFKGLRGAAQRASDANKQAARERNEQYKKEVAEAKKSREDSNAEDN